MPANPVLFGNALALEADRQDHTRAMTDSPDAPGPCAASRAMALVHVGMADVCAAFGASYPAFAAPDEAPPGASQDAAIAAAAHGIVSNIYKRLPSRFYHQAFKAFISALRDAGTPGVDAGVTFGQRVAAAVLGRREADLAIAGPLMEPTPAAAPPSAATHYVDPFHPEQGLYARGWGKLTTFVPQANGVPVTDPATIPAATKQRDFVEVQQVGPLGNSIRDAEQTQVGVFWSYDGSPGIGTPPRLYNQFATGVLDARGVTADTHELARQLALVNLALMDAGIVCWRAKYRYNIARPVRLINASNLVNGSYAVGKLYWEPLGAQRSQGQDARPGEGTNVTGFTAPRDLSPTTAAGITGGGTSGTFADPALSQRADATPNFPSYPSGHATFGAAAFRVLELLDEDSIPAVDFVSDEYNGVTMDSAGHTRPKIKRRYDSLSQAVTENNDSRVYLGVHWRYDSDEGARTGSQIGDVVFANAYPVVEDKPKRALDPGSSAG